MTLMNSTALTPPTDLRIRLHENGYDICAVDGKIPQGLGWQAQQMNLDLIHNLARAFPRALSTGIVCGNVIGVDVDFLDAEVAEATETLIHEYFAGVCPPVRYGKRPKRLFLFRAEQVFSGFKTKFFAPEGSGLEVCDGRKKGGPLIEVLGKGAQFVAFGIHEETNEPYDWPHGSPLDIRVEDLPVISEEAARDLIKRIIDMLRERFGYKLGERWPEQR